MLHKNECQAKPPKWGIAQMKVNLIGYLMAYGGTKRNHAKKVLYHKLVISDRFWLYLHVKMLTFRYVITVSVLNGYHTYISKAFGVFLSYLYPEFMIYI